MLNNLAIIEMDYLLAILSISDTVNEADIAILMYEVLNNELDLTVLFQEEEATEMIM